MPGDAPPLMPTRGGGCLSRLGIGLLLLIGAYLLGLLFVPPVLTATRTTLLLAELVELPIRPLGLVSVPPQRISTTYGTPADRLDLYLPAGAAPGSRLPAVVLALGVHPQPLDSPDVQRIASAIARVGVVVGVPDSAALRETRIVPSEPVHLADAVLVVAARPEVDGQRVGLAGFSAGASIALVAAADPRIADRLRYVSAFGGYADAETLLIDVASRSMVLYGAPVAWAPDEGIRRDLEMLLAAAADDPDLATRFFDTHDRQATAGILAGLPASLRADLAAISPRTHVERIVAPVYLLHGNSDTAIPISHALLLDDALGDRVARFTRFGQFGHGQPGQSGLGPDDLPDLWALLVHLHDIVAASTEVR
jgi:dienelactone hydrolase